MRALFYIILTFAALQLAACGGFATNSYKGLKSSALTYDMVMTAAADLYDKGEIGEETKAKVIELGRLYQTAHNEYLHAYKKWIADGRQESGIGALKALQAVDLDKFNVFVNYASKEGII